MGGLYAMNYPNLLRCLQFSSPQEANPDLSAFGRWPMIRVAGIGNVIVGSRRVGMLDRQW